MRRTPIARKELKDRNVSRWGPRLLEFTARIKVDSSETACGPATCDDGLNVCNMSLLFPANKAAAGISDELQFSTV
jgi:hypothetical protein